VLDSRHASTARLVVRRHHLYPDRPRLPLSCGDHGLGAFTAVLSAAGVRISMDGRGGAGKLTALVGMEDLWSAKAREAIPVRSSWLHQCALSRKRLAWTENGRG
jgi:hypothetical protein